MTTLANLIIVGVQKAGTTALHDYLSAHPAIAGAEPKEPGFYLKHGHHQGQRRLLDGTTNLAKMPYAAPDEYSRTFSSTAKTAWLLDSSTPYFQSRYAREQIKRLMPAAKILICLREPVSRAYSAYNWAVKEGWETAPNFEEALALEPTRREQGYWFSYLYTDTSFYSARVEEWRGAFPDLKIILFEDLQSAPLKTVNEVCAWLQLDPFERLDPAVKNPSGVDRSNIARLIRRLANQDRDRRHVVTRGLNTLLGDRLSRRLKRGVTTRLDRRLAPPPALAAETRTRLMPLFDDDIRRLEDLVGRDLAGWRRAAAPAPRSAGDQPVTT
jgi:hypothetical protein